MSRALLGINVLLALLDSDLHEFWPCDASLLDTRTIDRTRVHSHRQITDAYLLALAVAHDGRLVTFDRSLAPSAVPGATEEDLVIL